MKSKVLLLDDDPREILAFQQIFSNDLGHLISPFNHLQAYQNDLVETSDPLTSFDGVELLLAQNNDEALAHIQNNIDTKAPIAVLFISINHHKIEERVAFAHKVREIDSRVYVVILTDASGQAFYQQLHSLESHALVLKKPFEVEEIRQLTLHYIQAWHKDASLIQLQSSLKHKVLEKLFEASMYDLLNPVLLSVTDKVNSQAGLLDFLCNYILPPEKDKKTFDEITKRLHEDSLELTSTIRVMQQLFSAWDEVTVFTIDSVRSRLFSLIPELQNLPDDIELNIELNIDPELSLSLPVNLLILSITSLVRNALESVNRRLLRSNQPDEKGVVTLRSEMIDEAHLQLIISDNGEGFERSQTSQTHPTSTLLDNSVDESYPNAGVGLSVVNAFVEKVHGNFSITSEGLGKGATVKLVIPLSMYQA